MLLRGHKTKPLFLTACLVCVFVCVCVSVCLCVCVCPHVCTYMCVCAFVGLILCMPKCLCISVCLRVCVCTLEGMCVLLKTPDTYTAHFLDHILQITDIDSTAYLIF